MGRLFNGLRGIKGVAVVPGTVMPVEARLLGLAEIGSVGGLGGTRQVRRYSAAHLVECYADS